MVINVFLGTYSMVLRILSTEHPVLINTCLVCSESALLFLQNRPFVREMPENMEDGYLLPGCVKAKWNYYVNYQCTPDYGL